MDTSTNTKYENGEVKLFIFKYPSGCMASLVPYIEDYKSYPVGASTTLEMLYDEMLQYSEALLTKSCPEGYVG